MDRQQFLDILSEELNDDLQASEAQYQLNYYRDYIDNQIASGRSEAEVMAELGDPRMIARTVVDGERDAGAWVRGEEREETVYEERGNYGGQQEMYDEYDPFAGMEPQEPDLKTKLKFYGIIALVLIIIFVVLAIAFRLFIFFLPAIVCIAVISWIFKQF